MGSLETEYPCSGSPVAYNGSPVLLLHMSHFHLVIEAGTTHHLHLILCLVEIEGGVEEGVGELCLQWILCLVEVGGKVLVGVEVPVGVGIWLSKMLIL